MTDEWTEADDVIEEIREARRQLFARLDNAPDRIGAYYLELDKKYADRLVDRSRTAERAGPAAD
jgi:RNA binding exosome subunit